MVAQYIVTWSILELCEAAERKRGARVGMPWREHAGLDLGRERVTFEAAADAGKYGLD